MRASHQKPLTRLPSASPTTAKKNFGAERAADTRVHAPPTDAALAESKSMAQVTERLTQHVESVRQVLHLRVDSVEQDTNQKIAKLIELTTAWSDRWEARFAALESFPKPSPPQKSSDGDHQSLVAQVALLSQVADLRSKVEGQQTELEKFQKHVTSGAQSEQLLADRVETAILTSKFDDLERRSRNLERLCQGQVASRDLELVLGRVDRVEGHLPRIQQASRQLDVFTSQLETLETHVETIRTHTRPTTSEADFETLLRNALGLRKDEVLTGVLHRISHEIDHGKMDNVRRLAVQDQRLTNVEEQLGEQQKSSVALLEIKCLQGRLETTGLDVADLRQALDAQAEKLGSLLLRVQRHGV